MQGLSKGNGAHSEHDHHSARESAPRNPLVKHDRTEQRGHHDARLTPAAPEPHPPSATPRSRARRANCPSPPPFRTPTPPAAACADPPRDAPRHTPSTGTQRSASAAPPVDEGSRDARAQTSDQRFAQPRAAAPHQQHQPPLAQPRPPAGPLPPRHPSTTPRLSAREGTHQTARIANTPIRSSKYARSNAGKRSPTSTPGIHPQPLLSNSTHRCTPTAVSACGRAARQQHFPTVARARRQGSPSADAARATSPARTAAGRAAGPTLSFIPVAQRGAEPCGKLPRLAPVCGRSPPLQIQVPLRQHSRQRPRAPGA